MELCWKVRGFSREKKDFFDRYLYLDTSRLPPVEKHRVELCAEQHSHADREILTYRELFQERTLTGNSSEPHVPGRIRKIFGVTNYFEDEHGKEISVTEAARIQTGDENVVAFPPGYRSHDIRLILTPNSSIPDKPLDHIRFGEGEVNTLALFVRDANELIRSPFYTTSPILHDDERGLWVETLPVEVICSFVTIFRRLYMTSEPGSYVKACDVYSQRFLNKRLTEWIAAEKTAYEDFLNTKASFCGATQPKYSFDNKRLIDVFIYTRFAHQPDDRRTRQFTECLREVGHAAELEWKFYMAIIQAADCYKAALSVIGNELGAYIKLGGMPPSVDYTPFTNEGGRGQQLTSTELRQRSLKERAERLGEELWRGDGSPRDELPLYVKRAKEALLKGSNRGRVSTSDN